MIHGSFYNPAMTIALGLATGIVAQSLAHHLRIPGIVLLLISGVFLGPDGFDVIRPESLGPALGILTGFAVAVILFDGGMNLKIQRLRRERRSIRQLIILGGGVTVIGGALTARWILHWDWRTSLLFGTLVMVTGPTVINPLLRRLKVKRNVSIVLEAEGVLIDAVGAVVATVALEVALSPSAGTLSTGLMVISRLGFGTVAGLLVGMLMVGLLRNRKIIPDGIENVFILCLVLALFQTANAVLSESGIAAVTAAGIVVGNFETHVQRELVEFKEGLTVMLIGMLFVLLAADVRLAEVYTLGLPGALTVLVLMFVVRPLNVLAGTFGTDLNWREKCFISWIGPRGIIAAAVASLFAVKLTRYGLTGGNELRAMVFFVITVTVLSAGLTGGTLARILNLSRPSDSGWVILGANELARAVAKILREDGSEVINIDANPDVCRAAEQDCTRVIFGNGLQTRYLLRAEIDTRAGALAVTANEEANLLFIQNVKKEARLSRLFMVIHDRHDSVTTSMVHQAGAQILFVCPMDVDFWSMHLRRGRMKLERWKMPERLEAENNENADNHCLLKDNSGIAIALHRNGRFWPIGDQTRFRTGDKVAFLIRIEQSEKAHAQLRSLGWQQIDSESDDTFTTSMCYLVPETR